MLFITILFKYYLLVKYTNKRDKMIKELDILPDSENKLNEEYCLDMLERIMGAESVFLNVDVKNKHFLFNFGMLFNILHYVDNKKKIVSSVIEKPCKSFDNVVLHLMRNGTEMLPAYAIDKKKAFMISPVRASEDELAIILRNFKNEEIKQGKFDYIHYPLDDTNQADDGFNASNRICIENNKKIAPSGTIQIYYKRDSFGSIFDLGEYFSFKYAIDKIFSQKEHRNLEIINNKVNGKVAVDENDTFFKFLKFLAENGK